MRIRHYNNDDSSRGKKKNDKKKDDTCLATKNNNTFSNSGHSVFLCALNSKHMRMVSKL